MRPLGFEPEWQAVSKTWEARIIPLDHSRVEMEI